MPKTVPIIRFFLWLILAAISAGTIIFSGTLLYLGPKLPAVEQILKIQLQTPLRIYSSDNKLIAEFGEKKRAPIQYNEVPPSFINAILAAEDARFFKHHGVDFKGLTRAALELVTSGSIQTGGSTITMQVAKNYFLSLERTFLRKFNEILLALDMERKLSKNQILELYLNKIYLGHRAYGIQAAAQVYYGKTIQELSLAQIAMLAGLPKAPSAFNPITNPNRALIRRNWILTRMFELGYIDQAQLDDALATPVTAELHGIPVEVEASYFAEMVRRDLVARFGNEAYTEGYSVYTSLKSSNQQAANLAVQHGLIDYDRRHGYRGEEAKMEIPRQTSDPDAIDEQAALNALNRFRSIGILEPALVIGVTEKEIDILLKNGERVSVDFKTMEWARRYIDNIDRGPAPKKPADVVAPGHVIRVFWEDNQWSFAQKPIAQSALASLDPNNGAILALVGGFDFPSSKYNRATQGSRQAGSSFKPFIYSAALEYGMTPATIINDAPVVFADEGLESTWRPENSGGRFFGPTRLRKALYMSRNLVSIRVLRQIGVKRAINYAATIGFDPTRLPNNLSLALGSAAFTPLEMATAYSVLANGGYQISPWYIDRIENNDGETVFQNNPVAACNESCKKLRDDVKAITALLPEELQTQTNSQLEQFPPDAPRVQDPKINFLITNMMQDVIKRGTGTRAKVLNRSDLAGKTGTTNDQKDAWFSGFNSDVVASVWTGFDQPQNLGRGEFGGTAALPIWIDYMRVALQDSPQHPAKVPDGVVSVRIDPDTGKRVNASQTKGIFEYFREENVPEYDTDNSPADPYMEDEASPAQIF